MSIKKLFISTTFAFLTVLLFAQQNQTEGIISPADGCSIHYKVYGKGKPLLIINGGPGMNCNGFENLAIELSKNFATIIYDQRGTGKSVLKTIDTTTITMDLMVQDIESLRKQLKLDKWNVFGHSFGGMLAAYYATRFPTRIEKLILSSSGGIDLDIISGTGNSIYSKLSAEALDSADYWLEKINSGDTTHYAKLQRGKLLAPAYVKDSSYFPAIAERLTQSNGMVNQLVWTNMRKINFNCAPQLKKYTGPALIIQGKEDIVSEEMAEKAHQAIANSKVVLIEHSIHYGWLDNKEDFFNSINSFLQNASSTN